MGNRLASGFVTFVVAGLAGLLFTTSAINAKGQDLRPDRASDLAHLAAEQEQRNAQQRQNIAQLQSQIDELTAQAGGQPAGKAQLNELGRAAHLTAVRGPAVRVTLTDAPLEFNPPGVSPDLLVVHQQDIQTMVNALWAAGAEAMTIQGQRIFATSAIKCVGNTVVLHGTPYAPPYEIVAIGNQEALEAGLAADPAVQIYRQYAQTYQLGYAQSRLGEALAPGYDGPVRVQHAEPR